ncbi:protease [Salmonella enterica]|nr:protease [Salmonella enterica]
MAYEDINDILADGNDYLPKQSGGVLVVSPFGEQIIGAKDSTELPLIMPDIFLLDIFNWTGNLAVTFSDTTFTNFFSLSGITKNPVGTAGLVITSGNLMFPVRDKHSQVIFSIRLSGTVAGAAGTDREWKIQTRRPDGVTIVGSDFAVKSVADTSIDNRDTTLSSYALANTDPFFTQGIKLGLFNNSGQTITLTAVSIRVLQTINP